VPLHSIGDDWLYAAANLIAESRQERATRLRIARHAATRQYRLGQRLDAVANGRGRRAQAKERVRNAIALILTGDNLERAALAAGFKPSGRNGAHTRLVRACARLGFSRTRTADLRTLRQAARAGHAVTAVNPGDKF
jgi:hypothetical protein